MLNRVLFAGLLALIMSTSAAAQETTPEATAEITPETTAEESLPPGAMDVFPGAGGYTVRQQYGDIERSFRVYIPPGYDESDEPRALVFVMHGAGGTSVGTATFTGFNALADREKFIVVYPDGINNAWNDDRPGNPTISAVDDVTFLDGAIGFMEERLSIDLLRVYAVGYSMGGMMSFRIACELPNRFAAVASVASTMPIYLIDNCSGTPPIPVLVFQGTDDPIVPWVGVPGGYLSAAQTMGFWSTHNICTGDLTIDPLPDAVPEDYTLVVRQQLSGCAAEVTLYGVYFGGHTWPGHPFNSSLQLGQTSQDIDATTLIWEFFSSHVNSAAE